jgi:hypothetical protein
MSSKPHPGKPWHEIAAELLSAATGGDWYASTDYDQGGFMVECWESSIVANCDRKPNAQLIAAAPSLLRAALDEREELIDQRDELLHQAVANEAEYGHGYAAAEREIVEWLRADSGAKCYPGSGMRTLHEAADQIAAGAHRKERKL